MEQRGFSPPLRTSWAALILVSAALTVAWSPSATAQAPARGQNVAPVYEGFWKNADGSYDLFFGYYNRNWEEEIDVPVGPGNNLDPGGPDRGQPTHFFPRRNQFVFKVRVPANFGSKEIVWSLTSNGVTESAYGTLKLDGGSRSRPAAKTWIASIGATSSRAARRAIRLVLPGAEPMPSRASSPSPSNRGPSSS